MCEYCEQPNDLAFSKRKYFSICVAGTLFINDEKNEITDSLPIKYCPFCGRELLEDLGDENNDESRE